MKRKKFYIAVFVVFISLGIVLYFLKNPIPKSNVVSLKCPESYSEDDAGTEAYKNALIDWTLEFLKTRPKATLSDWEEAKYEFLVDNKCVIALERLKLSGKVEDLKPWELVDYSVQNYVQNITDGSRD